METKFFDEQQRNDSAQSGASQVGQVQVTELTAAIPRRGVV